MNEVDNIKILIFNLNCSNLIRILIRPFSRSGSDLFHDPDPTLDPTFFTIRIRPFSRSGSDLLQYPDPTFSKIRIQTFSISGSVLFHDPDPSFFRIRIRPFSRSGSDLNTWVQIRNPGFERRYILKLFSFGIAGFNKNVFFAYTI